MLIDSIGVGAGFGIRMCGGMGFWGECMDWYGWHRWIGMDWYGTDELGYFSRYGIMKDVVTYAC